MKNNCKIVESTAGRRASAAFGMVTVLCALLLLPGCSTSSPEKKDRFFTSGSREADQRATQRMAKAQQLSGGEDKKGKPEGQGGAEAVEERKTLFERLGGEQGINAIVNDFMPRVLQDPRVNWTRKGVERGGLFSKEKGPAWEPTPQNVNRVKLHMGQFFALATGGPAKYDGEQMTAAHKDMKITNPEFDAATGDLKATLDHLKIADAEQKELLAIVESTRPQIVTER